MATLEQLNLLIEKASSIAGSQARLADILGLHKSHITQMKQGTRAASWRVRGKLRAILGEDPAHAFMTAMAEDLEQSENEDEKKAADGFKTMLAAFPETKENALSPKTQGVDSWRKRMIPILNLIPLDVFSRLGSAINGTLHSRLRNAVFNTQAFMRCFTHPVLSN